MNLNNHTVSFIYPPNIPLLLEKQQRDNIWTKQERSKNVVFHPIETTANCLFLIHIEYQHFKYITNIHKVHY